MTDLPPIPPREQMVVCPFCGAEHIVMVSLSYASPSTNCQCGKVLMAVYRDGELVVEEIHIGEGG